MSREQERTMLDSGHSGVVGRNESERRWDELVKRHEDDTMLCSTWGHARRVSSVIEELRSGGKDAIRAMLRALTRDEAGMHTMTLLAEMAEHWPEYEAVTDDVAPGMVGFRVADARAAWVRWGYENGLLP